MSKEWIVVLEAVAQDGAGPVDVGSLRSILEALADSSPVALYHHERYAIQLVVTSATSAEAVCLVHNRWADVTRQLGVPESEVVRIEAMTPQEFETDCRRFYGEHRRLGRDDGAGRGEERQGPQSMRG